MSDETDNNLEPPKQIFDRFDGRGTYLSEVLVFFHGAPLERELLVAHGIKVSFAPKKRREARWFAKEIYLLPELLQQGAWFASVEINSLGPDFSETYWTLRLAVAPDDDPPEDMRERAFPGTFPGNLPALLRLGRIDGRQDLHVRAWYFTRRDRIPPTVEAIAPWLASTPPPGRFFPRWTTCDVAGYSALTQVTLEETHYEGGVLLKARGDLQTVISADCLNAIDAALWADLTTFLAATDRGIVRTETH